MGGSGGYGGYEEEGGGVDGGSFLRMQNIHVAVDALASARVAVVFNCNKIFGTTPFELMMLFFFLGRNMGVNSQDLFKKT